jgi:hypothetical protein
MIVNETLPVISDPVLGGGVQSVVVSTVLIVMWVLPFRHTCFRNFPVHRAPLCSPNLTYNVVRAALASNYGI